MGHAQIDAALASAVDSGGLAGVAATAWTRGGLVYDGAAGESVPGHAMRPDTVVWIASMTKAVTAAAVMQLVERGVLDLDQPAGDFVPYLREVQVLDGFDSDGTPRLRPPSRPATMRHLLTHTSGFGYEWAEESLARYVPTQPEAALGSIASIEHPLTFDPGERWSYSIGIDWAGRVVEEVSGQRLDAYFRDHLLDPLGMHDTTFSLSPAQRERSAGMHFRADDALVPIPFELPADPEMLLGGAGLYSTVVDYLRFTRMLLGGGELDGTRVLTPETVALMGQNHIGELSASGWRTYNPAMTNDVELYPGGESSAFGLTFLVNTRTTAEGRSPNSLFWAGLANPYYWVDPSAGVTGVFATQVLPFFDERSLAAFSSFERAVYDV